MKVTKQRIENVVKEVIGDDALKIVKYLDGRKNISEFTIAEKTKTHIQLTRNVLYRLNSEHLATYYRKKDRQKGWYISYWTLNKDRVKDLIDNIQRTKLQKLHERLQVEEANKNNFYMCQHACMRLDFAEATDFNFKCPECGSLLNLQDNTKTIAHIREQLKDLNKPEKKTAK